MYIGGTTNSYAGQNADVFNGGSRGQNLNDGPGGGATDIRTIKDSLYSRIIVAGGGGGAYHRWDSQLRGGDGGGINGSIGEIYIYSSQIPCFGSQYECIEGVEDKTYKEYHPGEFGKGGGAYCGGGGGGYFGGGSVNCSGGAGGSGYIGGVFDHPLYKQQTISGQNSGFGWARITQIKIINTCFKKEGLTILYIFVLIIIL